MGMGGAGAGGMFIAFGRGLTMLGLDTMLASTVDCLGESWEMLFGEVDVRDEAELCRCMAVQLLYCPAPQYCC